MPLSCPQCGIQVPENTAFCPGCGWNTTRPVLGTTGGIRDNIAGAMAYVTFIPAIVFLVAAPFKKNRFIRFHAFQALLLTLAAVLAGLVLKLIFLVLSLIPFSHDQGSSSLPAVESEPQKLIASLNQLVAQTALAQANTLRSKTRRA